MSRTAKSVLWVTAAVAIAVAAGVAMTGGLFRGSEPTTSPSLALEPTPASGTHTPSPTPTVSARDEALAAAQEMTDDEVIGQVIVAAVSAPDPAAAAALVEKYHLGGVILMRDAVTDADGVRELAAAVAGAGAGRPAPVLVAIDDEGGIVSRLRGVLPSMPAFMAAGALDDADLTRATWSSRGTALRDLGITVDFAPVADVTVGPSETTIRTRSASSRAPRASRAVVAASLGLAQGRVVPVIKHFPGHGSAKDDSHNGVAKVSKALAELEGRDLVPFVDAIDAGAPAVMLGHLVVKEWGRLPATVNPAAYEYLRTEMGFEGVAVTDALNMEGVTDVYPPGVVEAKALAAGADVVLFPASVSEAVAGIRKALAAGDLTRERLDEAAARVILLARSTAGDGEAVDGEVVEGAAVAVEASATDYSATAAVVASKTCASLISGSVGIRGGTQDQRSHLTKSLRAAGVTVVAYAKADTTVALLPLDRTGATADVVVALGGPWALQKSTARTYVAIWGNAPAQLDALATVLSQPGTAQGTWPVGLKVPYPECA